MSLKKLCKCGASISLTETKCKTCSSKYQSYYDTYKRENKEIYRSNRWKKLTEQCKNKFSGIDIYSLYKYNKLIQGKLSHHIVEVNEDSSKIYDIDNLIFVSDRSHKEIHERYNNNKKETQQELKKYILIWEGEYNKV